jgi:hypothetical protein
MEPNFKLLLDEMASLNCRFDEHDDRWSRRFSDLERGLNDRASAVDSRIGALETSFFTNSDELVRRVAKLESVPFSPVALAMVSRLATSEQISQQCFSAGLSAQPNGAIITQKFLEIRAIAIT